MTISHFFRPFFLRKARPVDYSPSANEKHGSPSYFSDKTQISQRPPDQTTSYPDSPPTARNVLKLALKTLSSVSKNIPFGAILSSVIDSLLDITDRIEQISSTAKGSIELAARIELLTPIVSRMGRDRPEEARRVVAALNQELQSITKDLKDARSQGKLEQFFNSTDHASSLAKHNMTLAQMIADLTLSTVHDIHKSLRDLELSKSPSSSFPEGKIKMGNITGGIGGTGGRARMGGEGGEGEGPELDLSPEENLEFRSVSGGTGGIGIEVGGKGGVGKGPIISILRRRPVVIAQPEREQQEEFSIL